MLRGRVLSSTASLSKDGRQSRWRNARDFLRLFLTDELADVEVSLASGDAVTKTDEEGFFRLNVAADLMSHDGAIAVKVGNSGQRFHLPVYSSKDASVGVISDIDDTLMQTGAFSIWRNLWTSVTGNVHTRLVFPDAVATMQALSDLDASFFYVSSSPCNLHHYLQTIFSRSGLPDGPMFLRDLGVSRSQFITGTHDAHKTDAIKAILSDNPQLDFVLVGDTGQHDAQIYASIVEQYQKRIRLVILRQSRGADLTADLQTDIRRIEESGVAVILSPDYTAAIETLTAGDWLN